MIWTIENEVNMTENVCVCTIEVKVKDDLLLVKMRPIIYQTL